MDTEDQGQVEDEEVEDQVEGQEPEAGSDDDEWQIPEGDQFPRAVVEDARRRYGDERMKRKEYEQKLEQWGGEEAVARAIEIQRHLQTDDGVMDLFVEAGKALGFTPAQIRSLWEAEVEQQEQEDEDRVLTLREARELLRSEAVAPIQRQQEQMLEAQAKRVVATTCQELGIDPQYEAIVLQLGDKYWDRDMTNPDKLAEAVRKGHADFLKLVEQQSQEYRRQKKQQKDSIPKTPNGSAGSAGIDPEPPKNLDEAIARARKRLGITA